VNLTLNRFMLVKNIKTTTQNIFNKCYNAKQKWKTLQFSGCAQRTWRLIQVHEWICVALFNLCFFSWMKWAFWSFNCLTSPMVFCIGRANVAVIQSCHQSFFTFLFFFQHSVKCFILIYEFQFVLPLDAVAVSVKVSSK
jgi:hypothetical protein